MHAAEIPASEQVAHGILHIAVWRSHQLKSSFVIIHASRFLPKQIRICVRKGMRASTVGVGAGGGGEAVA